MPRGVHANSIYNWLVARERKLQVKCPICKKKVESGDEDFPFCSERCRSIDLGRWASGAYVIPAPLDDVEELLEHPPATDNDKDNDNDDEGN